MKYATTRVIARWIHIVTIIPIFGYLFKRLKAERVNVMIPRHLLGRIDAASGGNRSRFLTEAAEQKLAG